MTRQLFQRYQPTFITAGFTYNPPPTIERFMRSQAFGRLIAGPVGSGKTTASIIELTRRMKQQMSAYKDPLHPAAPRRFTRYAIIRQTLKQLKDTVLKDVLSRYSLIADWRVSESTLYFREGDVHSEWLFVPLDEPEDKKRLLSTNLTAAFINECVEIDIDLLSDIAGRCGRFPNEELGVPSWKGIICDTNMPVQGSPWAKFIQRGLIGEVPEWAMFKQPGGRELDAENLPHLEQTPESVLLPEYHPIRVAEGRKYYERLVASATNVDYVRRYVDAEFGRDPSGSAVYGESFDYNRHVADHVQPVDDRMLIIGQDFGRNPGCLITQFTARGTLLVLAEIASYDMGLHQHIEQYLKPLLATPRFVGRRFIIVGDPAGNSRSSLFEMNEYDLLRNMGLPAIPAASNDPDRRIASMESLFLKHNGILIDESECPVFVEGLNGMYRYPKAKHKGISMDKQVSKERPEKDTPWSHVQDAGQYIAMQVVNPEAYAYAYAQTRSFLRTHTRARGATFNASAWT